MKLLRNAPPAVDLDFSPSPRRRSGWLGWVVLAIGVAALGVATYAWRAERLDVDERERIVERLRAEMQPSPAAAPRAVTVVLTAQELGPAIRVADVLNAEWAGVFAQLAQAQIDDVALVEFQADAARGLFRAIGQAPSLEIAFEYLQRLQREGVLRNPRIDSHEWVTVGTGDAVIRFAVTAQWEGGR